MDQENQGPEIPGLEEVRRLAKEMAAPIDFDSLLREGVLEKAGDWYKVNRWGDLPEHARIKVKALKQKPGGPIYVRFVTRVSRRIQKMAEG